MSGTLERGWDSVLAYAGAVPGKVARLFAPDAVLPAIGYALAFAAAALLIEIVAVGWRRSAVRKLVHRPTASTVTDVLSYFPGATQVLWLIGGAMTGGLLWAMQLAFGHAAALDLGLHLHPLAHALLLLVAFDFVEYWFHRACHETRALWQLHQFHHAAEEMTVFTVTRVHPVEVAIRFLLYAMIGVLLGTSPLVLVPVVYARAVLSALKHSEVEWRWGAFGNWVLQSPHLHRVHHSCALEHHHCNYAVLFTIWDRMFGTHRDADTRIARIGVENTRLNQHGFLSDLWLCYAGFLAELARPLRRGGRARKDT